MSKQRQQQRPQEGDDTQKPLTLWQTWTSVLSAFFGVQSSANKQRDLSRGKASHFIILGGHGNAVAYWLDHRRHQTADSGVRRTDLDR